MNRAYFALAFATLLGACNQTAPQVAAPAQMAPPPSASGAPSASNAAVTPGNMPAHCRGEASATYGVRPTYIQTGALIKNADGSTSIKGTADLGAQGKKPFQCNFDRSGKFTDVMSLVDEGKM